MHNCLIKYDVNTMFSLENLPYGVFSHNLREDSHRIGVAIGDKILDLYQASDLFSDPDISINKHVFKEAILNSLMSLDHKFWSKTRKEIQNLLTKKNEVLSNVDNKIISFTYPMSECKMHLPVAIGDYTDFYCSKGHADNMGLLFRGKKNDLPPNWLYLPVGYHGRASSVVISKTPIRRPKGQLKLNDEQPPIFGPSQKLDIELEMAFFIGGPENPLGNPIDIKHAHERIFGLVLMNDWSARDIQKWEYFPLGPFLGKSFGTSISPWIVTMDALRPFIIPNIKQEPEPLPYLRCPEFYNFDIALEVWYKTPNMEKEVKISTPNLGKHLYWNIVQMLTHHASNGCNLRPGDLMGTGTISGEDPHEFGSLVELSWNGTKPLEMPNGDKVTFLQDGDEVILRGKCSDKAGAVSIGFGECRGHILPSL